MENSEQWLTSGICSECRRDSYCKKPCTKHKRMSEKFLREKTLEAMTKMMGVESDDTSSKMKEEQPILWTKKNKW